MERARILVVEDDASARDALEQLLTDEGYEVETATDGLDALEKASEFGPDLVLTDLRMPLMSGRELIENLQRIAPSVVVLAMTAATHQEAMLAAGSAPVLQKPLDLDDILMHIERALSPGRDD